MDNQTGDLKTKQLATYGALILIVAAVSYYIYTDLRKELKDGASDEPDVQVSETSGNTGEGVTQGITLETKTVVSLAMPKLNRSIPSGTSLSEEVRTILAIRIKEWSDKIAQEPNNSESWVYLGVEYKTAGDYEGAREAWEYAAYLSPNSVAHQNLGDLYAYYLKDFAKAEAHFLEAIRISPSSEYLYFKAAEFYRDVVKDISKARSVVEGGIRLNPSSTELKDLIISLQ